MNCEECTQGVTRMPQYFAHHVNVTDAMLSEEFCKDADQPCPAHAYAHRWLPAVLDKFVLQNADHLCQAMEACDSPPAKERFFTCDDCLHGMHFLVNHISDEQHVVDQVVYLQGEGDCDGQEDHPDCPAHVAEFYPPMHQFRMTHILENNINDMCAHQCEPHSTHPHSTPQHPTHPPTPTASP